MMEGRPLGSHVLETQYGSDFGYNTRIRGQQRDCGYESRYDSNAGNIRHTHLKFVPPVTRRNHLGFRTLMPFKHSDLSDRELNAVFPPLTAEFGDMLSTRDLRLANSRSLPSHRTVRAQGHLYHHHRPTPPHHGSTVSGSSVDAVVTPSSSAAGYGYPDGSATARDFSSTTMSTSGTLMPGNIPYAPPPRSASVTLGAVGSRSLPLGTMATTFASGVPVTVSSTSGVLSGSSTARPWSSPGHALAPAHKMTPAPPAPHTARPFADASHASALATRDLRVPSAAARSMAGAVPSSTSRALVTQRAVDRGFHNTDPTPYTYRLGVARAIAHQADEIVRGSSARLDDIAFRSAGPSTIGSRSLSMGLAVAGPPAVAFAHTIHAPAPVLSEIDRALLY